MPRRRPRTHTRPRHGGAANGMWSPTREPAGRAPSSEWKNRYGRFCAVPWRATAPGPGMLAAESTSVLKVPGMQKMLTSFAGSAGPPVVRAPAGEPVSTMVRAMSSELKAPPPAAPFCRQCVKVPVVKLAQSVSAVQGIGRHGLATLHGAPVVPVVPVQVAPATVPPHLRAKVFVPLFEQKPQKTFICELKSTAVVVFVPVSSTKEIGSAPSRAAAGGGQSWLVG